METLAKWNWYDATVEIGVCLALAGGVFRSLRSREGGICGAKSWVFTGPRENFKNF